MKFKVYDFNQYINVLPEGKKQEFQKMLKGTINAASHADLLNFINSNPPSGCDFFSLDTPPNALPMLVFKSSGLQIVKG